LYDNALIVQGEILSAYFEIQAEITGSKGCLPEPQDISGQVVLLELQQAMIQAGGDAAACHCGSELTSPLFMCQ
jgi:hypothetical protein